MNAYITLDGKKYATLQKDWTPVYDNDRTVRHTTLGVADVTFADGDRYEWEGTLVAKATPETGYGSRSDLVGTLAKKSRLSFTDHYGTTVDVVAIGPFRQRASVPDWEVATFYIPVKLVKA